MDKKWSYQDMATIVPIVAPAFAFTFVVGYFLAFDISWFSFFSLPEHIVFALRDLPIALAISAVFVTASRFTFSDQQAKLRQYASFVIFVCWLIALTLASIVAYRGSHLLLAVLFALVILGELLQYGQPPPSRLIANLYWATTMMILTLMVGYLAGFLSQHIWQYEKDISVHYKLKSSYVLTFRDSKKPAQIGQVIFAGSSGVLFYVYSTRSTHLFRREDVDEICEYFAVPKGKTAYLGCAPQPKPTPVTSSPPPAK